jgi:hypothetical protein
MAQFKAKVEKLEKGWNVSVYFSSLKEAQEFIAEKFREWRDSQETVDGEPAE